MQLERGFLHLVFTAYNFQSRVIRFPDHFTMNAVDNDGCWEFDSEGESPCDESGIDLLCTNPGSHMDSATTASISTPRNSRRKRLSLSNWWASGDGPLEIPACPVSPVGDVQFQNSPRPASPMQLAAMTPRKHCSNLLGSDESSRSPPSPVMGMAYGDGRNDNSPSLSPPMQLAAMTPRSKRASLSNWWEADESSPCPPSPVMKVASPSRCHSHVSRDLLDSMEMLRG